MYPRLQSNASQAISILTQLILVPDVPVHGEVCPGNWIYHRTLIPDIAQYHDAEGVRFKVHVHQGDVYYMVRTYVVVVNSGEWW